MIVNKYAMMMYRDFKYGVRPHKTPMATWMGWVVFVAAISLIFCAVCRADTIDIEKLATAIYHAEGGAKTNHPYGILTKYKHTSPRQACINTIKSALKRYRGGDFIEMLGKTYCPVGAKNDPHNLNKNWVRNVKHYYEKG